MRTKPGRKAVPAPPEQGVVVGWNGLTLRAPEGWSPVSISGEGEQGYLKVVSPDTRYLEVKWERPKGVVSVPDALERYFQRLRRTARRARRELRIRERPRGLAGVRPRSESPIPYAWEADRAAVGCIWHCAECRRLVIAELCGEKGDDLSPAAELLRGARCHGEEFSGAGRWNTWALYGLTVPAPPTYRMERHTLMTGHQRFQLRSGGCTLQADRWGLAEIALRGTHLREWYESRESGALFRYAYRVEEIDLHGHAALRLSGRNRLPFALLKLLRMPFALALPRFGFEGYVWRCEQSNRIYAVLAEQPRRGGIVGDVVRRMRCHPGGDAPAE